MSTKIFVHRRLSAHKDHKDGENYRLNISDHEPDNVAYLTERFERAQARAMRRAEIAKLTKELRELETAAPRALLFIGVEMAKADSLATLNRSKAKRFINERGSGFNRIAMAGALHYLRRGAFARKVQRLSCIICGSHMVIPYEIITTCNSTPKVTVGALCEDCFNLAPDKKLAALVAAENADLESSTLWCVEAEGQMVCTRQIA